MTAIPLRIIMSAPEEDFGGHSCYTPPCNYCGQSNGEHHYACPVAVRKRGRAIDEARLKQTKPTIELVAEA